MMRAVFVLGKLVWLVIIVLTVQTANASNYWERHPELRSAFLGPDAWGSAPLTANQISNQLKTHFGEVLKILDSQREASLNEAVTLLEEQYGPFDQAKADWVKHTLVERRDWQMSTLIEYAQRGQFPRNENHAVNAVPIFVDNHETHCAVGYLMHRSGHDAAVAEVVDTNNLVYVKDATEGQLVEWIKFSGLTQGEAALIQPAYEHSVPGGGATLTDFENVNYRYRGNGMTISELSVSEFSFNADTSQDVEQIYAQALFGVNVAGVRRSNGFRVALGSGPYDSAIDCYMCEYTPGFDDWMFLQGPLQTPFGSNASMYRIDYRVQAPDGLLFDQISTSGSGIYDPSNAAFPNGEIRVVTEAYNENGAILDKGMIDARAGSFLGGLSFLETDNQRELLVTNYVFNYGEGSNGGFGGDGYRSHWQGFGLTAVPEPATSGLLLLIACGMAAKRRR